MKELDFDGRLFLYDIVSHDCGEYGAGTCYTTDFYDTEEIITERKKFILFGPIVQEISYKKLFTVNFSIESEHRTKKEVRKHIQHEVDLMNRREEIKRGEFV
jgi:hypothetical protein